jgi:hypothetical protein
MWLKMDVEKGKQEIDKLQKQLILTEKPETTLTVFLTQAKIDALRQVMADMISNTQTLEKTVQQYMSGTMKGDGILVWMTQIRAYQTSCQCKDGWIWNEEAWNKARVLLSSVQQNLQSFHDYEKQFHKSKEEFYGFKLLRECATCMGDVLNYRKICTNAQSWKDAARQVVGLPPASKGIKMQMLLNEFEKLGEHGDEG